MTNSSGYLENRYGVLLFSIGSHQNEKKASVYVAMPGESWRIPESKFSLNFRLLTVLFYINMRSLVFSFPTVFDTFSNIVISLWIFSVEISSLTHTRSLPLKGSGCNPLTLTPIIFFLLSQNYTNNYTKNYINNYT